jgi:succinate-semialdehyde dehydrogenase / glutarate-semialdehyde dehydrogenase
MATIAVRNPRTGEIDTHITPTDTDSLHDITDRLRAGQRTWQAANVEGRAAVMTRWKDAIAAHKDALVSALTHDTGRARESGLEVLGIMGTIDRWCQQAPALLAESDPQTTSMPFVQVRQQYVPYPLVGVISPWNFPLLLSLIDTIPALLAGCAVIVKPSEVTPRFIEPLQATIEAVPELANVLAVIPGGAETGQALIDAVDSIAFTGSVATGRKVGTAAAANFIPAFLELGGKDAAIVLENADIDYATSAILWGATSNAGQACQSIERVYVQRSIYDDFITALTAKAQACTLTVEGGPIGPIIAADQVQIIENHLHDALEKGAVARCGGEVEYHNGGAYCRPTVLTDVDHTMQIMREETFGPVLPVMAFDTAEEAVALANDTHYGLSGAVFGTESEAHAVARQMDAGAISINDAALTSMIYDGEKTSFKSSGLGGSRMGASSIKRFLRTKALIHKQGDGDDPWWFDEVKRKN